MRTTFLPPLKALREVAREGWPGDSLRRFKVDATGWTNLMLEADGWLMFRFPRWPSAARSMGHEVRLLEYLGRHLSVRVPGPLLVGSLRQPRGWPFMAYRKLPGTPLGDLSQLSRGDRTRLAQFLAQLFKELAGLSPG
ncbi:MAG: phosphotransferase, partial [Thermoplasmata archaeon]